MPRRPAERQSHSAQWRLDLDGVDKLRLEPLIATLVDGHRGTYTHEQYLRDCAIKRVLIGGILDGRFEEVHESLGAILGRPAVLGATPAPSIPATPSGVSAPIREHENRNGATPIGDGAMREMAGRRKF